MTSQRPRFWHAFFGAAGTLNDVHVINCILLFCLCLKLLFLPVTLEIILLTLALHRKWRYCSLQSQWKQVLASSSYYRWYSTKVAFSDKDHATCHRRFRKAFFHLHEAKRNKIVCTFVILQARWGIVTRPCFLWGVEEVKDILICFIILHDIMVDDRSGRRPYLTGKMTKNTAMTWCNHHNPTLDQSFTKIHQNNMLHQRDCMHHELINNLNLHNLLNTKYTGFLIFHYC